MQTVVSTRQERERCTYCDPKEVRATRPRDVSTEELARKSGILTFVTSGILPLTTLTNEGSRYLGTSSAMRELNAGVDSAGFRTTAFPAAIAPHCERVCQQEVRMRKENALQGLTLTKLDN
jgi:hypothetical protein